MKKGLFITFEGTEGSGKSTQIEKAASFLKSKKCKVVKLREPGGTRISEAVRDVLLNHRFKEMKPETELLLYLAARSQITYEKIMPALKKGKVVICDRYEDSTLAYQGFGRGFSVSLIRQMSLLVRRKLQPDVTFLLDMDPRKGLKRGGRIDRMEKQTLKFHQKVRRGFLSLAKNNRKRFTVIDATLSKSEIAALIRKRLEHELG